MLTEERPGLPALGRRGLPTRGQGTPTAVFCGPIGKDCFVASPFGAEPSFCYSLDNGSGGCGGPFGPLSMVFRAQGFCPRFLPL